MSLSDYIRTEIEAAWEVRESLNTETKGPTRTAVDEALMLLDSGQARVAGRLGAREESQLLTRLITRWALRSNQDLTELCAQRSDDAQQRMRPLPATASVPAH